MFPLNVALLKAYITQGFTSTHFGHDYGWITFTKDPKLFARAIATVVESRFDATGGGGNVIALRIDLPFTEYYLLIRLVHLKSRAVIVGDKTTFEQVVGIGGNTGNSTAAHLHYETWIVPKTYTYRTVNNTARKNYAVNPSKLISMSNIDSRNREVLFVSELKPTESLPIAKPIVSALRLRAMAGLSAPQLLQPNAVMPEEGLPFLGYLDGKIDGYIWAALLLNGAIVYCAAKSLTGVDWIKIENEQKEVQVIKEVPVEVIKEVEVVKEVPTNEMSWTETLGEVEKTVTIRKK